MISRKSSASSAIRRRASSKREGFGSDTSLPGGILRIAHGADSPTRAGMGLLSYLNRTDRTRAVIDPS